ncbi:Fungal specific transcription factor domain [Ceratobasidium sp. AG-Ba]|nr:Fungal specific transcription factor domain [Ceratobasidium sp. AG-Ba]
MAHINFVRARFFKRITSSNVARWSMFVGAQMFRELQQEGVDADIKRFIPWLDRLSQLCVKSSRNASLEELIGCLAGGLELAFLQYMVSTAKSRYTLLRHIAPIFVQIASANPDLWSRDPLSSGISLAHALVSPHNDLARFIFTDTATSLTFGVPPLVEYDTSHPIIQAPNGISLEWVHGCPVSFILSIAKINQWRARYPNGCWSDDIPWKEIERDIWAWRPMCEYGPDSESLKFVARLAVQEAWRHANLIYLYMGMCCVNSHDPRVQASVRQISRLNLTVNCHFETGKHIIIPLLIAGICTRSESDRKGFRRVISQPIGSNKSWLLKGIDFALVLDHLWSGVGMDGGPVMWDDYVASRRRVIDIGV